MTDQLFDLDFAEGDPKEFTIIVAGKLHRGGSIIRPSIGDRDQRNALVAREKINKGITPMFTTGKATKFSQWSSSAMLTCPYCNKTHSGQGSGPTKSDAERLACNDFHKHTCRCGCQFRVDGRKIHQQD